MISQAQFRDPDLKYRPKKMNHFLADTDVSASLDDTVAQGYGGVVTNPPYGSSVTAPNVALGGENSNKEADAELPLDSIFTASRDNIKRFSEVIDAVEAGIRKAGAVTKMLEGGMTPEEILTEVCGDLGVLFFENEPVCYKCYCSRERVTAALISLGIMELEEIAEEEKNFPVECQFCDTVYEFTPADVQKILKNI